MVMQCPAEYHLCLPNKQRSEAFCDLDLDCVGDQDNCRGFTVACPAQTGCCVVSPFLAVVPDPPPPAPPRPPAPLVPVCPQYMHLCAANKQQAHVFCDVDQDCWGDEQCGQSPAGRCIQHPTIQPKPDGWVAPLFNRARLSTEVCDNLFLDRLHLFRRMWGPFPRTQNRKDDDACWARDRWAQWSPQPAEKYFEDILSGRYCKLTDWYENYNEAHGWFTRSAPALLGFDPDIHAFCNNNCDAASVNMLALFGRTPYNTCRNFEWQMCAVRGLLNWQGDREIVFARAPKTVYMDGYPPFGRCSGYSEGGCNLETGFANDDIFYLELCLFSQVCANSDRMFELDVGERFVCDLDLDGFERLKQMLLEGPSI